MSGAPAISVVVIGRNEGARLLRCLDSVARMDAPDGGFETIYVDSASSDGSVKVAAASGALVLALPHGRLSAARARNAGWRAARGEFILFLDGDTVLHPGFARRAAAEMRDAAVAAVWGHRREMDPTRNFYHRVLDLDWVYPAGVSEFCGGDALMRRSALAEVNGFCEDLIAGEEPELCARLRARGRVILHIDAPMTLHDIAMTRLRQYWRRAIRAGYAYAEMARRTEYAAVRLWRNEARGNLSRAAVLLGLPLACLALAATAGTVMPLLAAALLLCALVARSAWRARWKSSDPLSLLCFGFHSHLQQIPILAGQLSYWRHRSLGRHRRLIEYK